MDKLINLLNTLWTHLLGLVDLLLLKLSTMSISDLLKWMIVLSIVLIIALGVLNAAASVVNQTLSIVRRLFHYSSMFLVVLIVVFWVFTAERPCIFNAESHLTSCLTKDELAERQKELEAKAQPEKKEPKASKK